MKEGLRDLILALELVGVLGGGCQPRSAKSECLSNSDCIDDKVCVSNQCESTCSQKKDCPEEYSCQEGLCNEGIIFIDKTTPTPHP